MCWPRVDWRLAVGASLSRLPQVREGAPCLRENAPGYFQLAGGWLKNPIRSSRPCGAIALFVSPFIQTHLTGEEGHAHASGNSWVLTDAQWQAIEAVLPRSRGGRPRINDQVVVTGLLHSLATGAPFAELETYANPSTLETRFRRWNHDGTLQRICDAIGFKPLTPHQRHLRHGMGHAQRQAIRDKGWSRYW